MKWYELIGFITSIASLVSIFISIIVIAKNNSRNKKIDKILLNNSELNNSALFVEFGNEYKKFLGGTIDLYKKHCDDPEIASKIYGPDMQAISRQQPLGGIKTKMQSAGISAKRILILTYIETLFFSASSQISKLIIENMVPPKYAVILDKYLTKEEKQKNILEKQKRDKENEWYELLQLESDFIFWDIYQFIIYIYYMSEELVDEINKKLKILIKKKNYKLIVLNEVATNLDFFWYYELIFHNNILCNIYSFKKNDNSYQNVELIEIKSINEIL